MFEVVAEVLDMKMHDIAKTVLDVDEQRLEVGLSSANGFNDIASWMSMTVIDFDARSRLASSMTLVDFNAWRIDGSQHISSRRTVVDNEI
jgi:hypothetical protein